MTGNQSRADDRRIENETGFKVFRREDFLTVLESYPGSNPIMTDFRKHLQELEDGKTAENMRQAWRIVEAARTLAR